MALKRAGSLQFVSLHRERTEKIKICFNLIQLVNTVFVLLYPGTEWSRYRRIPPNTQLWWECSLMNILTFWPKQELLNFPICWMHYKTWKGTFNNKMKGKMFVSDIDNISLLELLTNYRMLKRSIVCFGLESRVWDSLFEDIRSSWEERGSMVWYLVNYRQYYSYSDPSIIWKVNSISTSSIFTNFTAKKQAFVYLFFSTFWTDKYSKDQSSSTLECLF